MYNICLHCEHILYNKKGKLNLVNLYTKFYMRIHQNRKLVTIFNFIQNTKQSTPISNQTTVIVILGFSFLCFLSPKIIHEISISVLEAFFSYINEYFGQKKEYN